MFPSKRLLLLIACSALVYTGRSQLTKRGIVAKAVNQKDSGNASPQYAIYILNPTDNIIYLTHSYHVILMEGLVDFENTLAPLSYTHDTANYTLHYAGRDTSEEWEGYRPRIATFMLPHQFVTFTIRTTRGSKHNRLSLDYISLPDFCYRAALKETQSGSNWVKNYKVETLKIPLE